MTPTGEPAAPHAPFDRARRIAARRRVLATTPADRFLIAAIRDALLDRLDIVTRPIHRALLIGGHDRLLIDALVSRGMAVTRVEECAALDAAAITGSAEALPDAAGDGYDLVLWPGGLEAVNDVPGALFAARAALKPDGLLLGALFGDGSFPLLRRLMLAADGDRAVARMHPQIDVATLGNLLQRVGYALPVADVETLDLAYRDWRRLIADVRAAALGSALAGGVQPLSHGARARIDGAFDAARTAEGRAHERVRMLVFTGWRPDASQPQPARRGSATASLADALRPRDDGDAAPNA